ncbi:MAG: hypothetical protein JSS57_25255 [Proteobacteria bacterium]|nr:hypothetical protein [Pseudomonadota bacterium]
MLRALAYWWHRNRRRVLGLLLLCAFFFALGYFTPRVASPLMCKVYG